MDNLTRELLIKKIEELEIELKQEKAKSKKVKKNRNRCNIKTTKKEIVDYGGEHEEEAFLSVLGERKQ